MQDAILITGFNNWGKTTIINHFFGQTRFYNGYNYAVRGLNSKYRFTVESHSNDDYQGMGWVNAVYNRLKRTILSDADKNLFTAMCPSMEPHNNFVHLLTSAPFSSYKRLHVFLIKYKWEHHAELMINNIIAEGSKIPNVRFIVINADAPYTNATDRWNAKSTQILDELRTIFP